MIPSDHVLDCRVIVSRMLNKDTHLFIKLGVLHEIFSDKKNSYWPTAKNLRKKYRKWHYFLFPPQKI